MDVKYFDKKIINNIVCWIPIKKLRNNVRKLLEKIIEMDFILDKFVPKGYIKKVYIDPARHCNIACYSCFHFSPLADEEYYDFDVFKNDIKRLYELTGGLIQEVNICGGEPLLNKNTKYFFSEIRKYFKNSYINLITNGTLLLKQDEEFWKSCHDSKITICPTRYPIKIDWDAIREMCKKYDVWFDFVSNSKDQDKISFKKNIDVEGKQDFYQRFLECDATGTNCVMLFKGKIYTCPFAAKIKDFNKYFNMNIPITEKDSIDIYNNSTDDILSFLAKPIPLCRYCGKSYPVGLWRPSKKDISEYI